MNYGALQKAVSQGLSIREIATKTSSSYTTVRYWLQKHGLSTMKKRVEFRCRCGQTNPKRFYGHKRHICGKCQNDYVVRKGRDTRERIIVHLGGGCSHCGYVRLGSRRICYHTDPGKKDPNFRSVRGWSWARIEKELKGCIILCKNHHGELHAGVLDMSDGVYVNGRRLALGASSCEFESHHPDH